MDDKEKAGGDGGKEVIYNGTDRGGWGWPRPEIVQRDGGLVVDLRGEWNVITKR